MFRLRSLAERDLFLRVEWMNDPRIYQTMSYSTPVTLENTINWFNNNKTNKHRWDLVLEDAVTHKVLVMTGLIEFDLILKKAESYTFVNPNIQFQGLGKKSLFAKLLYGFEVLKLNKIYSYINEDNMASRKMVETIGFKLEELKTDNSILRMHYCCVKEDFNKSLFDFEIIDEYEILLR